MKVVDVRPSSAGARWLVSICLAYLMLRPVGFNEILLPVIAVLGLTSIAEVIHRRRRLAQEVGLVIGLFLAVGVFGSAIGSGNPGLPNGMLVWLAAPVVFGVWTFSADERMLRTILRTSALITIVLSTGIILFVGGSVGVIPQFFSSSVMEQAGAGFGSDVGGATAIRYYGVSTLVGAAPMWATAAILPSHPLLPRKLLSTIAAITAAGAVLLAGRNAIVLVLLLVPLIIWIVARIIGRRRERQLRPSAVVAGTLAFCAGLFAAPAMFANAAVQRTWLSVGAFFSGQATESADQTIRSEQANRLVAAWGESPFFGHGWGATLEGYSRGEGRQWTFELQYHMLLFQVGLMGVLVVLVAVGVAVTAVVKAGRTRPDMIPLLLVTGAAAMAMLIANATNPYLQAPGHMWAVYLVLMVTNIALTAKVDSPAPFVRAAHAATPSG